jgi:arylsulfatase A-like enzyme
LILTLGIHGVVPHASARPPAVTPQFAGGPNILLIVTDDQRIGTMSVMPRTRFWFNKNGTKFAHAYATTPQCCPSRSTLMTGQFAHNHSVSNNAQTADLNQDATIQRYLHDNGYRTGLFGKFLNSWRGPPAFFDRWVMNNGSHRYYDGRWNVDGNIQRVPQYSTDFIRDQTLQFIQESEGDDARPWYAYVSVLAPHTPAVPAPEHAESSVPPFKPNRAMLETSRRDKPGYVRHSEADLSNAEATRENQMRTLMSVDDMTEAVFSQMGLLGEIDNTIAVFMSDNGFLLGEHGLFGPTASKGNPYTAAIKVPFSIRWPGHFGTGVVDTRLATNADLLPTLLEAAGIAPDPGYTVDGRSLLQPASRHRVLTEYIHTPKTKTPSWASIRTRRYQYIETYDWGTIGTSTEVYGDPGDRVINFREFYYLRGDPWQNHNVLADKKKKNDPNVRRLHRLLNRDQKCAGTNCE